MNFFGHAVVARSVRSDARFVLGSMVPDFASMVRSPAPEASDAVVQAGLQCHHQTDAVFHDLPRVRALMSQGLAALTERGVRRGPARAVAHVGVELLLDAAWADAAADREAYSAALRAALGIRTLRWSSPQAAGAFSSLAAALLARGVQPSDGDAERVVHRLERTLRGRPRLEPTPAERRLIARWVDAARDEVLEAAPVIRAQVEAALSPDGAASDGPRAGPPGAGPPKAGPPKAGPPHAGS